MKWGTEGKGGLVACESRRAYSLRRQREMSLESRNLVVLCLDSGCAWSE